MIADLPDFRSINRLDELPRGRYVVVESVYRPNGRSTTHAVMTEIVTFVGNETIGVDLQVFMGDGELRFRDFCLTASGAWRDSYGATAWMLKDLLPRDLLTLALKSRQGTIVDHDGRGKLIQVRAKEHQDGA